MPMDLWVVAAITGAGYAAKYLQNFSREKEGFSGLMSVSKKPDSPSLIPHFEENAAFSRKSAHRRSDKQLSSYGGSGILLDGRFGESPTVETASTSGFEGEIFDRFGEGFEVSARAVGTLRRHRGGQNSVRSRNIQLQYLKPLNSLGSCLMAQIYKERSEMEDHVLTPPSSPCVPALRPFVVTDGTRVISLPSFDSFSVQVRDDKKKLHLKAYSKINEAVLGGIPQLPERRSGKLSKESGLKKEKDQLKKLSSDREMPNEMQMSSQEPPSGAALFCLGVSIGVMYSILANKREVTKLKDFLKQTENLVQDLQEELEMNDSLTVKELASVSEHNAFPYEHESSIDNKKPMMTHLQSDSELLMNYGVESSDTHKAPENLESINQIEAELEAELERLELNMKSSTLRAKYSDDDDELDADIVADLVQGEFRADFVSRKPTFDPSRDNGSSSSTTPCSPNQAVSPRELSLRLHQVIQSRLEQRIMELEAALGKNQKRVKHLESEQGLSHNYEPSSSSSSRSSLITIDAGYPTEAHPDAETEVMEHKFPLVMNLSGEALDAYNEAFEELNKVNGSALEERNSSIYKESAFEELNKVNGSAFEERNSSIYKESQEKQLFHSSLLFQRTLVDEEVHETNRRTLEQLEMFSFDEGDDLLIRQIVEKARQGSSAILHAHRAMVSLDSSEK